MKTFNKEIAGKELEIITNKFAKQADGSVMITSGGTQVLVTAVVSKRSQENNFFPLTVNYNEKLYAAGKIPGNYPRREARPSDQATLSARMIDRPIRPLFPEGYMNEVQIVCTVMSLDQDYLPEILALNGASISLLLAKKIPFFEPCAAVNVAMVEGELICNPTQEQRKKSKLDLYIAGTENEINMVEANCDELTEKEMVDALLFGHEYIKQITTFQKDIIKDLNIEKEPFDLVIDEEIKKYEIELTKNYEEEIKNSLKIKEKLKRYEKLDKLEETISKELKVSEEELIKFHKAFDIIMKQQFRKLIIDEEYRVDGRKLDELRILNSEIELLKNVHGSAMFTRGETQVLSAITLGVKSDAQLLDGLEDIDEKSFMLHYNFPPYSVGETGRMGAPGRREIGHGHLAENAISKVLPKKEDFPYTIRAVAEVLESNGSSSQATICATSMALMQAGVPIKKPVAGIAMGLICEDNNYKILTDIQGLEDHLGDMDFKVAGTKDGICAIQMDIKVKGISREILTKSLEQARIGREKILENMNEVIKIPNEQLAPTAPKIVSLKIDESKIKDVIGKGGSTIDKIIEETDVKIDIEEDGTIFIYGVNIDNLEKAKGMILKIAKIYNIGEQYLAKVVRISTFGAFVRFDGYEQEALLHISDISKERIEKVEDHLKLDQIINVEIKEVDKQGRIKVKLVIEEVKDGE